MNRGLCPERIWTGLMAGLAVLLAGTVWPFLLRTTAAFQIDYNEGWNVVRAGMAAHLVPLYGAPPVGEITNYPPLSFHLVGLLSRFLPDATLIGRLLSLASLLVVCLALRLIARQLTASPRAGSCAALLFVIFLEGWMPGRIGTDDPQLLGMAFETLGFFCFLGRTGRGVAASAVLFSLGVFTKHNLLAMPLGVALALVTGREWRLLLRWGGAGLVCSALLFLATMLIDGPYFLAHMLRGRAYMLSNVRAEALPYILVFLPFLGIGAVWVRRNAADPARGPLAFAWLAAQATAVAFSGGDGTGHNLFFEAIALDVVIAVTALHDHLGRRPVAPAAAALLIGVPLLFPLSLLPGRIWANVGELFDRPRLEADFAAGVAALRGVPAPVVCENLLMCDAAGKSSAFDPFFVMDQIRTGRLDECRFVTMLEDQRLAAVEIGDIAAPEPPRYTRFTPLFLQTLARRYRVALRTPEFAIWLPADTPRAASPACPGRSGGRDRD